MSTSSTDREVARQLEIIRTGVEDLLPEAEWERKLARSLATRTPLRVKQGFDPTAPDIHLGHTVGLRKLRQFQELGHQVVLIVGSYTALIGDPSGRSQTRPRLTEDEVTAHARTYLDQFFKVVDPDRTEVRWNGDWFRVMSFLDIMHLAGQVTVARLLERDDFEVRFRAREPISVHELFYPLMQGYDSVAIRADVELGATEQKFNLLTGRDIQTAYGMEPQVILTLPVLEGIDGVRRMSKSLGNYIGISEPPNEIYGKTMSIPDTLIVRYARLVTDATSAECDDMARQLEAGTNPMGLKQALAHRLVRMYQGVRAADAAQADFEAAYIRGELPAEIPTQEIQAGTFRARDLMMRAFPQQYTGSEAGRLFKAGAVQINGERVTDTAREFRIGRGVGQIGELTFRVGRKFARLILTQ